MFCKKDLLVQVLERSWANGLDKMMITGGSLEDSTKALEVAKKDSNYIILIFYRYII